MKYEIRSFGDYCGTRRVQRIAGKEHQKTSWEAAYFEIKKNSDTAEKVLNMLSAIGVI